MKPAEVRFYLDADVLGLAKVLGGLRSDVTYPGDAGALIHKRQRPACPIRTTAVLDIDWIPVVSANNWLIITRDSRISEHKAELQAVKDNGARMVALGGKEAGSTWAQLEMVMMQWR